jgi:uncharacterized membrane protein
MSDTYNPNQVPPVPQDIPPTPPPKKDNTIMLVLSYLWILFLVPLIAEKNDPEVQWHAKHGMILTIVEFVLQFGIYIVSWILSSMISSLIGCITCFIPSLVWIAFLVIRILSIVKATKGERFLVPGLSQYVDSIKL